ncbi:uncharacterized protein PAC_11141 [Phialocephala subalpina]|uniref:GEgh 16 protein n=1 Tax=Phialocephala subalpina TaxID=576137 RepID=A0A1L7X899_9HELO|nr:uncharacterized protein PAC_11141 [Phialocephala subalpina]
MLLSAFTASGLFSLASAHCLISTATGDLGGNGTGLGVAANGINNQGDVTVFKATTGFGATGAGGAVVPATLLATQLKITGSTIPQVSSASGVVTMTLHQINADGAGPMTCSVSADASGKAFAAMTIMTNVPGTNGKSTAANADFPLVASLPAGTTCTGTVGALTAVCAVKCANPAGPFGSVVLVQQVAAKKVRRSLRANGGCK